MKRDHALRCFLETSSFPTNKWINYDNGFAVYVRRTKHLINKAWVDTLDFANLKVNSEGGVETAWRILKWVEAAEIEARAVDRRFYAESVHNPVLQGFFRRRGYELVDPINHCFLSTAV